MYCVTTDTHGIWLPDKNVESCFKWRRFVDNKNGFALKKKMVTVNQKEKWKDVKTKFSA